MKLSPMGWALIVIGGIVVVGGAWYLFVRPRELPPTTGAGTTGTSASGTDWRALVGGIAQGVGTIGGEIATAVDSANHPRSAEGL